jgi:hypothetical protein
MRRIAWPASIAVACLVGCESLTWDDLAPPLETAGLPTSGLGSDSTGSGASPAAVSCGGPKKLEAMDPTTLPSCCSEGAARCVPDEKIPSIVKTAIAKCGGGYCIPDAIIKSGGAALPRCKSINDVDGACVSVCVPQVAEYKAVLPQANCGADERCAPCINPLDGKRTGVCDIGDPVIEAKFTSCSEDGGPPPLPGAGGPGGDGGPALPCPHVGPPLVDASKFPACAAEGGAHCVPANLVPGNMTSQLNPCSGGFCVPDPFIAAGGRYIPPTCRSIGNLEGRCVHSALPSVTAKKDILPVATCQSFERCAPCFDPETGLATGACTQSCDPGPSSPPPGPPVCPHQGPPLLDPAAFPACGSVGGAHCMPKTLVPDAMRSQLVSCGGAGLCVPDVFIASAGRSIPPTCRSVNNAEGRCLHVGLKQVADQASQLPRASCQGFEKCVPCYNPIDGQPTGACTQSCDPGPTERPKTFGYCCGGAARCVPESMVPDAMEERLSSCGGNNLCVPAEHLNPNYRPPTCSGWALLLGGSYSGVCLSECLTFSGLENIVIKQGTCGSGDQCVPCYRGGAPTGAPGCPGSSY